MTKLERSILKEQSKTAQGDYIRLVKRLRNQYGMPRAKAVQMAQEIIVMERIPRRMSDLSAKERREYDEYRSKVTGRKNPSGGHVIYDATRGIELRGMRKGPRSKFAGEKFQHTFKEPVEVIGLPNGDVLLRPKRK